MANIKDVAKKAGVSIATVSRVINKRGYLSDKTINIVRQAMKELDYFPNDLARSLHRQHSNILGLIIPSLAHPFFGEVASYIEYYAHKSAYKLLVCNSLEDSKKEKEYITMLKRSQVDGIVVGSHTRRMDDFANINLPLVSLDRRISETTPYVCSDNYLGGELAARHLISRGCRRILHICGSLSVDMLSNQRTQAFLDVCEATGVEHVLCQLSDRAVVDMRSDGDIPDILRANPDCDGLFATSDVTAAVALRVLAGMGKRVPEDVKIVGFDDSGISYLMNPQITTIQQPMKAIGKYVVECLVRKIAGQTVPLHTTLPVKLIERASTALAVHSGSSCVGQDNMG